MKDFFKYGLFYNKMTEGRIFIFVVITLLAAACEAFFAISLLPVIGLSQKEPGKYVTFVYSLLKNYGIESDKEKMLALLIIASISIVLAAIGIIGTKLYTAKLQAFLLHKVQMETCPLIFESSYSYFISKRIGFLNNAVIQQIPNTAFAFKHYSTIISGVILSGGFLIIPIIKAPFSILSLFICMSPMLLVLRLFNRKNRHYSVQNVDCYASFNNILLQVMGNFKYIKATSMIPKAMYKIESEVKKLARIIRKMAIWGNTSNDIIRPYAVIGIFALLFYAVSYRGDDLIETVAMFGFLYMAYQKSVVIPMAYQKFLASTGAIQVYEKIIRETGENPDPYASGNNKHNPDFSQKIVFDNVSFSYASSVEPVLNNINIEIYPKQSIAIVGESGSGKSTLVNLITGLFKPQKGSLMMGAEGYDLLDIHSLRQGIGYITQEPVIFNDSVKDNIALWKSEISIDEVTTIAKKAHADEFINEMSEKYETLLGDNGVNISGGQRQRLTIARELFRNPPIMIFDEATSSLDSKTEGKIQKEIDELKGERTIIIIAHRLSTIKNCDKIYVLDKGKLIEQGTYDELYDKGGHFREMIDRQSL